MKARGSPTSSGGKSLSRSSTAVAAATPPSHVFGELGTSIAELVARGHERLSPSGDDPAVAVGLSIAVLHVGDDRETALRIGRLARRRQWRRELGVRPRDRLLKIGDAVGRPVAFLGQSSSHRGDDDRPLPAAGEPSLDALAMPLADPHRRQEPDIEAADAGNLVGNIDGLARARVTTITYFLYFRFFYF